MSFSTRIFLAGLSILVFAGYSYATPPKAGAQGGEPVQDEFLSKISGSAASSSFQENINPYSGQLAINMVDIRLPGKGGLDLVVQRYYKSSIWNRSDNPPPFDITYHAAGVDTGDGLGGNGWQMHMGKVRNAAGNGSPFGCGNADNATVIMPDGSEHTLYQHPTEYNEEDGWVQVTAERWRYQFDDATRTWFLTLTNGTVYEFRNSHICTIPGCFAGPCADCTFCPCDAQFSKYFDMLGNHYVQATAIEDVHGNRITIEYDSVDGRIERITDTWNRKVEFDYINGSSNSGTCTGTWVRRPRIDKIQLKAGTNTLQTWDYNYASSYFTEVYELPSVPCGGTLEIERRIDRLTEVVPPEGNSWRFTYKSNATEANGNRMLSGVTFPSGATTSYTYSGKNYDVGLQNGTVQYATLASKTVAGRDVTSGTWSYSYPSTAGRDGHQTTVSGPNGFSETYKYHGWKAYVEDDPNFWKVGLLDQQTTTIGGQTITVDNTWTKGESLSNDLQCSTQWNAYLGFNNRRFTAGVHFIKPSTVTRTVARDGDTWVTTSSSFDAYGNPTTVSESGERNRSTSLSYWYNTGLNILTGRLASRDPNPGGSESFEYNSLGRLTKRIVNGVETRLEYYSDGLLKKEIGENGSVDRETEYSDYAWGQAKVIKIENGSTDIRIDRTVEPLGVLASEEDGRNFITDFDYDSLGRLTKIEPPLGDPTFIAYAADGSEVRVKRAASSSSSSGYDIVYSFDGLDRLRTREDEETDNRLEIDYNALGVKTADRVYPGGVLTDTRSYDLLGRTTSVTHADSSSINFDYDASEVTVSDERGEATTLNYQAFGDPDGRLLTSVVDAENNTWTYSYDSTKNLLTRIDAPLAMGDRSFTYTTQHFLASETNPESGTTSYQYSPQGQRTKRTRGSEIVNFMYDRAGRLTAIDPPGTADDVDFTLDGAGLRTEMTNPQGTFEYTYDGNQRLTLKRSTLGSSSYDLSYAYDSRDRLTQITYPSGRKVAYDYNVANRVTAVEDPGPGGDFATDVTYHASGGIESIDLQGGVTTTYSYDNRHRVESIDSASTTAGDLVNVSFGYDASSNVTDWTDQRNPQASRGFEYDALSRMTGATSLGLWGVRDYSYDDLGNRTQLMADETIAYTYQSSTGRMTEVSGGAGSGTYTYDAFGRLTRAPYVAVVEPPDPDPTPILEAEMADSLHIDADDSGTSSPGDTLKYTVTVTNDGDAPATAVSYFDLLSQNTVIVSGSVTTSQGSILSENPGISVSLGTLAEEATATITFQTTVEDPLPIGIEFVSNQGIVSSDELSDEPTDDPATPANDDATVTDLDVPPPPANGVHMTLQSLGENLDYKAGGLAVFGWATSPSGIQTIELNFPFNDTFGVKRFEYGWPRPDACDFTDAAYDYRDPNCPNVGFWALLDSKTVLNNLPNFQDYSIKAYATANVGPGDTESTTVRLHHAGDNQSPLVAIEYPSPTEQEVQNTPTVLHGWAVDGTGIVDLTFTLDGAPVSTADYAYGIKREEVCVVHSGIGDPNCRIPSFSRVGWELMFDGSAYAVDSQHQLVVTARDAGGRTRTETVDFVIVDNDPEEMATPFLGEPFAIPRADANDVIRFADYDLGGMGVGYYDNSPGDTGGEAECDVRDDDVDIGAYSVIVCPVGGGTCTEHCFPHVRDLESGEWLGYTVQIAEAGYYTIIMRDVAEEPGGEIHFELDGVPVTPPLTPPLLDPSDPEMLVAEDVYLEPAPDGGTNQLRMVVDQGYTGFLQGFVVLPQAPPASIPFGGTAPDVPGLVQAEHYDTSTVFIGQWLGYLDNTPGNLAASPFRLDEWVDAGAEGTRTVVKDLEFGEWLDYTLDVTENGPFDLELRFANESIVDGDLLVAVDGTVQKSVTIPSTGGGWLTGMISDLDLPVGEHVLRLAPGSVSYKLDSMDIREPSQCPATANDDGPYSVAYDGTFGTHWWAITDNDLPATGLSTPEVTLPPAGTLAVTGISFTYTPPEAYQPTDSFEYSVYSDDNPSCWDTATIDIQIDPPPAPNADFTRSCIGLVCTFDGGVSTGTEVTYTWDFGDSNNAVGEQTSHVYTSHAAYTATLAVTDVAGQRSVRNLQVHPMVGVADGYSVVFGSSVSAELAALTLNDLGPGALFGGVTRQPVIGDLTVTGIPGQAGASFTYTPSQCTGQDSFEYRVDSTIATYASDTALVSLTLLPDDPPAPAFAHRCTLLDCSFTDQSSDDSGFEILGWNFGDGSSSVIDQTPSHSYAEGGVYNVELTIKDLCGQIASISQQVTVDLPPSASFTVTCDNLTCVLDATGSSDDQGIETYQWDLGDGTTASGVTVTHAFFVEGEHTIVLTVIDASGQADVSEETIELVDGETELLLILMGGAS